MTLEWKIKCDRCGYIIDALQEEFVQNFNGEDLCDECYKVEMEKE